MATVYLADDLRWLPIRVTAPTPDPPCSLDGPARNTLAVVGLYGVVAYTVQNFFEELKARVPN